MARGDLHRENLSSVEQKENDFEILEIPKIIIKEEKGTELLSLMLKAIDPKWGNINGELPKMAEKYFKDHPLNNEFFKSAKELTDKADEEALYNLALTYNYPERTAKVFEFLKKHKSYIVNPQELQELILGLLKDLDQEISSSPLGQKITEEAQKDKESRLSESEEVEARIADLIDFFRPDATTTKLSTISLATTDQLSKKNSGYSFDLGEEIVIIGYRDNEGNLEHEFLHRIINPIIDKLSSGLTQEQKKAIIASARQGLKKDYGDDYYSLLCEELIRTYNDVFQKGEKPLTRDSFLANIGKISEKEFKQLLLQDKTLKERCALMGIKTLRDMKNKAEEYYKLFEKNELRRLIFDLYTKYADQQERKMNFEQFFLQEFKI